MLQGAHVYKDIHARKNEIQKHADDADELAKVHRGVGGADQFLLHRM